MPWSPSKLAASDLVGQLAFGLFGLTVPLWSCPGRHLLGIGVLKLGVALIIARDLYEPLGVMLRARLRNTVSVGMLRSMPSCSAQYHANGHAFWFVWAALSFMALGQSVSLYRHKTNEEMPLAFAAPWLAISCVGCYAFPTSGFSSVCFNAAFLLYRSLL